MKKKQLKKRMKAKKGLASAAVALLMSGSLLPVGNVFADEQSIQESSASSAEAKTNLEKDMLLSEEKSSTETTQNTETPSESSEEERISIPETARDSKASTQDATSELPEGLRNAKSTRLSDGRISVDISTADQLQDAFNTSAIGQVNLVNDVVLTKQINMYSSKNPNLTINGNSHTIDFGKYSLWGPDGDSGINVKLMNLKTLNGGGWAVFDSPSATLEVEDVEHKGAPFSYANQIRLSGKVDCQVIQPAGSGSNVAFSNYYNMSNANLIVSSNANVKITHAVATGGTPYTVL